MNWDSVSMLTCGHQASTLILPKTCISAWPQSEGVLEWPAEGGMIAVMTDAKESCILQEVPGMTDTTDARDCLLPICTLSGLPLPKAVQVNVPAILWALSSRRLKW